MSNRKKPPSNSIDFSLIEVKSKFEAEYRRFSLKKDEFKVIDSQSYQQFHDMLADRHSLQKMRFSIYYRHPQDGDLLPINNNENFMHALGTATPSLRLFLQRGDMPEPVDPAKRVPGYAATGGQLVNKRLQISVPQDFRRVSAIIDVDILPESIRRVRLCKHNSDKPLGFYIRDGTSIKVTTEGLEKVPGIFVSRLVPGGLAESTGLLSVNDEVLEVNGIEVTGKTLDQVTEMMVANSQNLIVTVKPVHQNQQNGPNNALEYRASTGSREHSPTIGGSSGYLPPTDMEQIDSDEEDGPIVTGDGVVHV